MADYTTKGSFNLGNQITLKNKNSNIDRDYGPYENKTLEEIAEELKDTLQIGKTIGVIESGKVVEYWWQNKGDGIKFIVVSGSETECERDHEQDRDGYIAWVSYGKYGFPQYYYTKEGSPEVFEYRELLGDFLIATNSYETITIYEFVKKVGGSEEGSDIVVDSELSLTSTNPIQNQAVAKALGGKADSSTVSNINTRVGALEGTITSKADNSTVEALQAAVGSKAESSEVSALSGRVDSVESNLEGKVSSGDFNEAIGSINGDIAGKADKVAKQDVSGDQTISPNTMYVWGSVAGALTITKGTDIVGIVNNYMVRFTAGEGCAVTFSGFELDWYGGEEPTWTVGNTYEISIVDNIALWAEFEA